MSGRFSRYSITVIFLTAFLLFQTGCKKMPANPDPGIPLPPADTTVVPVEDPPLAKTMGFFLDDWAPGTFTPPPSTEEAPISNATVNIVTIDASSVITRIPLSAFGQNANIWMTPMITEPVFMNHVTHLRPHIIRWPAGAASDVYFWNQPYGVLPPDVPRQIMDKDGNLRDPGYGYGRTNMNWQASIDQYYAVLQQSGSRGMITVNYGYARYGTSEDPVAAAAHLAADWVRYDNGRTPYWEIGNETFGDWAWGYRIDKAKNKDGQPEYQTGKLYAEHFQVFADSMKKAASETGKTIYVGATLYESPTESWQTNTVKTWNSSLLPALKDRADFFIVHNYFTPYNENSNASTILNAAFTVPGKMMQFTGQTLQTYGAQEKPVALTEWNMWARDSKQQVSNVSGLFALLVLGESLKNKYGMTARWNLSNAWENGNDHGLFSAGDEPNIPRWNPRPSFYFMYFFQKMLGDRLVPVQIKGNANIRAYASTYTSGEANLNLINISSVPITVEVKTKNFRIGKKFYWYTLEGGNDNGEFSRKVYVNGRTTSLEAGGPSDYASLKARSANTLNGIKVIVPGRGAVVLVVED